MVLLVVDTQKSITNDMLYAFEQFKVNVQKLIGICRENNIEVIYVRHDDGIGGKTVKGTMGFEIFDDFKPNAQERIFDKTVNSAFKDTGLAAYLRSKNENQIMIIGLQTDYCIDATIKCGFDRGFEMIVPALCNTTVSNEFLCAEQLYCYYNKKMWNKRYAKCLSFADSLSMIHDYKNH